MDQSEQHFLRTQNAQFFFTIVRSCNQETVIKRPNKVVRDNSDCELLYYFICGSTNSTTM